MVCENRDLGIGFPSCPALLFEEGVIVDMNVVRPQDVKTTLRSPAKAVAGKRWATKHECAELEDGVWVEPLKALPKGSWEARCLCSWEAHCRRRLDTEKIV